ncbi:DNase I-like protein [Roridomyces roridus]|uniref:DNase I-like protein n=1 Tax=Roridomyces roridus TaxID=1738132 RepID=A0AAD7BH61_9AGAR|nr:DNase I-like protein [Roridomyces roridus]
MATEGSIRGLMRPSDQVKVILDAFIPPGPNDPPNTPVPSTDSTDDLRRRRIVAVVAHSDGPDTEEEGSVFVLKAKAASSGGTFTQSDILRVFPVFGDFSISMAQVQVRRATLDLRRSASQTSAGLISLTIKQGDIPGLEPLTLHTQDVQTLREVLAECKRLKEIAEAPSESAAPPLTTFSWLAPYTLQRAPLPDLFSSPPDLRTTRLALLTRLSPAFAGSEGGDDLTDVIRIRDDWIARSVREECVSGRYPLRIRIGSFNVNGNLPSQDLSSWLGISADSFIPPLKVVSPFNVNVDGEEKQSDPFEDGNSEAQPTTDAGPDLYVLGFQELDLSTEALIYSTTTVKEDAWCTAVFAALGERAEGYEKLASKQLVGILIIVIVRKALRPCFSEIKGTAAGTGIMGLMGNKGGTTVRMKFTPPSSSDEAQQLKPTVLTFVNSHLAAFDEMYEKRNTDFNELARRLVFDSPIPGASVFESDVVFWMGDLNYRIDAPDVDVRTILGSKKEWGEDGRFDVLLRYDQLKAAMRTKKAFDMFEEGRIEHLPTYRFNAGLLKDDLGYDLKRRPAWTDRILYASNASAPITQLSYDGHPQITMSDHRPVSAEFNIDVDIMHLPTAEKTADKLYRQLKGLEDAHEDMNARVNLKILNSTVDMGKISYGSRTNSSRTVEVRNIGKVPCAYRLVPVDSEEAIHPDWLTIEPMTALLLPDEVVQITLTASIDLDTAARLNIDHKALDCTLILHTVMGKDHFIAVTAEYEPTCFANSLARLTRLPGPIRSLTASSELLAVDRAINAPREIMRLVNWMMAPEIKFDNVFVSPADPGTVDIIRECLDTGADFPFAPTAEDDKVPIAFGEALFRLLESLTEPLVPYELHARCAEMTSRDEAFEMLDALPAVGVNVWISVTAFLHFVCSSSSSSEEGSELRTRKIASKFASALLPDAPPNVTILGGNANAVSPVGRRNFLLYFIE